MIGGIMVMGHAWCMVIIHRDESENEIGRQTCKTVATFQEPQRLESESSLALSARASCFNFSTFWRASQLNARRSRSLP
jgi:hypothetical protein